MKCKECEEKLSPKEMNSYCAEIHLCESCLIKNADEMDLVMELEINRFNKRYNTDATYKKLTGDNDDMCPFDLRDFPLMKGFQSWGNIKVKKLLLES